MEILNLFLLFCIKNSWRSIPWSHLMRDSCLVKVTVSEKRNFSILCLHNRTFTQVTNFQKAFFVYVHIHFQKAIFCLPVYQRIWMDILRDSLEYAITFFAKLTFSRLLRVNNYEIIVNFFHISHNLRWYSVIVHRFTRIYPVCSIYQVTKQFMQICVKNCAIDLKKNNL